MKYKFIIIESRKEINLIKGELIEAFESFITFIEKIEKNNFLILIFKDVFEINFNELIDNLTEDLLVDLRLYESNGFSKLIELNTYLDNVIPYLVNIPFDNVNYLTIKNIVSYQKKPLDKKLIKLILGKYFQDYEMLKTIKTFILESFNASKASGELFLHRNTLLQRLDKFYEETGFNPKEFYDSYLIFDLL